MTTSQIRFLIKRVRKKKHSYYLSKLFRVKWYKQMLFRGQNDWKNVLLIDETMFFVFHGNKGARVWRLEQKSFEKQCLKRSVEFATFVIVWSFMTAQDPGWLHIDSTKVNSEVHQEIFEHFMSFNLKIYVMTILCFNRQINGSKIRKEMTSLGLRTYPL